jgi:hypothetical protein
MKHILFTPAFAHNGMEKEREKLTEKFTRKKGISML